MPSFFPLAPFLSEAAAALCLLSSSSAASRRSVTMALRDSGLHRWKVTTPLLRWRWGRLARQCVS